MKEIIVGFFVVFTICWFGYWMFSPSVAKKEANKEKDEVDKEFDEGVQEPPYDITKVSSPVLIIAQKWKANPSRVKVKNVHSWKSSYVLSDKRVKDFSVATDSTRSTLYVNTLDTLQLNRDELMYLNCICGDEVEVYYKEVVSRYERVKDLVTLKERKRIQKLFQEVK